MVSRSQRTITVVGDRFVGFADGVEDVYTLEQFLERLQELRSEALRVRAGQGISPAGWRLLTDHVRRHGLSGTWALIPADRDLAGRQEAHKHHETNTLIADLSARSDTVFTAHLRVHNDNELLLDHQTGRHVQGMVSVEAARQMFLAVTERYFASAHPDISYYYVINSLGTTFANFLFPLDATVEYRLLEARLDDPARMVFDAEISIHQAGRLSTCTRVAYTAFDAAALTPIETRRAVQAAAWQPLPVPEELAA